MKHISVSIYIIMLSCFSMLSCDKGNTPNTDNTFTIVATTGMIADAARIIAGETTPVVGLMGPGVDPHLYKPSQGDIQDLYTADLVLYNGLLLEGKMQEVLQKMQRTKAVVAVTEDIPKEQLLSAEGHAGAPDPHIWFDVKLWKMAVQKISQSMQEQNPSQAAVYAQNTERFILELDSLDHWVQRTLTSIPAEQRVLITAHDAFGYFGRAYGIEVRGLQGISTLAEFGLRDIQELVKFIAERRIPAVFIESSVSEKSLEAVVSGARRRGQALRIGGSLYSDALGPAGTPEGTYVGMVRHNVTTITKALSSYDQASN